MSEKSPSPYRHWKWFRNLHAFLLGGGVTALFVYVLVFLNEDPDTDRIGLVGARPEATTGGVIFLLIALAGWFGWFVLTGRVRHEFPHEPSTAGSGSRYGVPHAWSDAVRWFVLVAALVVAAHVLIDDTVNRV